MGVFLSSCFDAAVAVYVFDVSSFPVVEMVQ